MTVVMGKAHCPVLLFLTREHCLTAIVSAPLKTSSCQGLKVFFESWVAGSMGVTLGHKMRGTSQGPMSNQLTTVRRRRRPRGEFVGQSAFSTVSVWSLGLMLLNASALVQ